MPKGLQGFQKGHKQFAGFQKGNILGHRSCRETTKNKISLANSGERNGMYGKKQKPEAIKKIQERSRLLWQSKEHRRKMSERMKGEKHFNWKGGIGKLPYPFQFTNKLKLQIRKRDRFICQLCGMIEKESLEKYKGVLCVNHIDFDKNNCKESNLNTLCRACNSFINFDRNKWKNYFQKKLFKELVKKV